MTPTSRPCEPDERALWLWVVLAWLAVVAFQMWTGAAGLDIRLGDSDDAMRLVEARAFLAGHGWYDMSIARLQPPQGYVSHWSRLIDAGLAGLYLAARPFAGPVGAEWFMRLTWPLLWLLPSMAAVALIARKLGGERAALIAIAFAAVALPAQIQFQPGRIDHHNVQIALALAGLAAAVWQERPMAPALGGIFVALMLTIGLETVPFAVLVMAAFAITGVMDGTGWKRAGSFGGWLAVASLAGLAISLPPARWFAPLCDQIAINSAGAVALGGAGLWLAARIDVAGRTLCGRLVSAAVIAGVAIAFFAAAQPACLAGPFALVDPAIRPIWLNLVGEAKSLPASLDHNAAAALSALAFPLAALVLAGLMVLRDHKRANVAFAIIFVAVLAGVALMFAMIRTYSYAAWFAMPLAAAGVVALWDALALQRPWQKAVPAVMCSPLVLTMLAVMAVKVMEPGNRYTAHASRDDACLASASYRPIAALPKGLVAANVNIGAHLLALTPHDVLSAPYHRLSRGIVITHAIMASAPDEAHKLARDNGVGWIVLCPKYTPGGISDTAVSLSLFEALKDGRTPAWLREVPATAGGPLIAYKVEN